MPAMTDGENCDSGSRSNVRRTSRSSWATTPPAVRPCRRPAPPARCRRDTARARRAVAAPWCRAARCRPGSADPTPTTPAARRRARCLRTCAQRADRFGQRELFARQAGDEAPAADLAARFQPVVDAQQFAPRRQPCGFAFEQAPADHAVAAQQGARDVFDRLRVRALALAGIAVRRKRRPRQRPAPRILDAEQRRAPSAARERRRPLRLPAPAARASRRSCRNARGRARPVRPARLPVRCAAGARRRPVRRRTTRRVRAGTSATFSARDDSAGSSSRCAGGERASTAPVAGVAATRSASRARARRGRCRPRRPAHRAGASRRRGRRCTGRPARRSSSRRRAPAAVRVSHAPAGASKPSSCASTPASASGPADAGVLRRRAASRTGSA